MKVSVYILILSFCLSIPSTMLANQERELDAFLTDVATAPCPGNIPENPSSKPTVCSEYTKDGLTNMLPTEPAVGSEHKKDEPTNIPTADCLAKIKTWSLREEELKVLLRH